MLCTCCFEVGGLLIESVNVSQIKLYESEFCCLISILTPQYLHVNKKNPSEFAYKFVKFTAVKIMNQNGIMKICFEMF